MSNNSITQIITNQKSRRIVRSLRRRPPTDAFTEAETLLREAGIGFTVVTVDERIPAAA